MKETTLETRRLFGLGGNGTSAIVKVHGQGYRAEATFITDMGQSIHVEHKTTNLTAAWDMLRVFASMFHRHETNMEFLRKFAKAKLVHSKSGEGWAVLVYELSTGDYKVVKIETDIVPATIEEYFTTRQAALLSAKAFVLENKEVDELEFEPDYEGCKSLYYENYRLTEEIGYDDL